jgi:hypothetical protein
MTAPSFIDRLITRERMRIAAICVLAATVIGLLYLVGTARGTVDSLGRITPGA